MDLFAEIATSQSQLPLDKFKFMNESFIVFEKCLKRNMFVGHFGNNLTMRIFSSLKKLCMS